MKNIVTYGPWLHTMIKFSGPDPVEPPVRYPSWINPMKINPLKNRSYCYNRKMIPSKDYNYITVTDFNDLLKIPDIHTLNLLNTDATHRYGDYLVFKTNESEDHSRVLDEKYAKILDQICPEIINVCHIIQSQTLWKDPDSFHTSVTRSIRMDPKEANALRINHFMNNPPIYFNGRINYGFEPETQESLDRTKYHYSGPINVEVKE